MTITDEKLHQWRELAEKATPVPWHSYEGQDGRAHIYSPRLGPCREVVPIAETTKANADFIVTAREAVPALIDQVSEYKQYSLRVVLHIGKLSEQLDKVASDRDKARELVSRLVLLLAKVGHVAAIDEKDSDEIVSWPVEPDIVAGLKSP